MRYAKGLVGSFWNTVDIHTYSSLGAFPLGKAPRVSVFWSAHGRTDGGGD